MPQTASVNIMATVARTSSAGLRNVRVEETIGGAFALTDGVSSGQSNKGWNSAGRTLAANASENLDLAGVLLDESGAVLNFSAVKLLMIRANPANPGDLTIGGAAANAWVGPFGGAAGVQTVRPGGVYAIFAPAAGYPVVANTGDLLRVLAGSNAGSYSYDVQIVGVG